MKPKLILIVFLFFASSSIVYAQDNGDEEMQTLFGKRPVIVGGYGGPKVGFSQFDGKDIWLVGGRGGAIFNHVFSIGGAGYGIVNSPYYSNITYKESTYNDAYLQGCYGGLQLEYILKPYKVVHISFPLLIGAGGLQFTDERLVSSQGYNMNDHIICNTAFFVIEPGLEIELNVIRFMRLAIGLNYRYAHSINLPDVPSNPFNTLTGSVSLKFGSF